MNNLYALLAKVSSKKLLVHLCCLMIYVNILNDTANAQTAGSFTSSTLTGETLVNPTSLQFGPDNRLYVSQQNGTILVYTIKKNLANNYSVLTTETILSIKNIPNHNDDGTLNSTITDRQVTGILVAGTSANPELYVSSSDPRIGGGGTAGDKNLDTNSGIISKLTWNGSSWVKVDIVKGLPRSEENHSNNGMAFDEASNMLYVAMGGHTNAGAPSNNFAFITEYALSAAILKIDLSQIQTQYGGSYTLPTLDDPTRANSGPNGSDVNDPWGGNDGVNQAKLVAGGPVQIYSAGYRNAYDLVITKTPGKAGRMYTIDNGANSGWGGYPDNEGTASVTNKYVVGEPGSTTAGVNDAKVNNLDNLHLVSSPGMTPIYGGHPNPIRANPSGAGIYTFNNTTGVGTFSLTPTPDWPPVPVSMANSVESDFRNPGVNDGALYTWPFSTNGIAEYTSLAFNGALAGDLLAASFDGNIYRIKLDASGTAVSNVSILAGGFGSQPLDVIAQGDNAIFPGTVWAATYGANSITIFEPVIPSDIWSNVAYNATGITPPARHENGFVEVNGKFYIVGGRIERNINIFDPKTKIWSLGAASPVELNHFQAVAYNNEIYAIGALSGSYPNEVPLNSIYKYSIETDTWTQGAAIPSDRRRGSAGVVLYNNKFYIIGGIQNGHIDGWVPWTDEYDPATGVWTVLPDAPVARDHFMATLINGKIYAAGGRQTHYPDFAANTIASVDVYDITTKVWTSPTQIPTQRGAPGVAYIDGKLVIAGGEISSSGSALAVVEAYDPLTNTWQTKPGLDVGRHATQMISYQGRLYLCAGSTTRGGSGQTNTMSSATYVANCTGDVSSFSLDDDDDGYSNGDETANGTDPCSAASKPEDFDQDFVSNLRDPDDDNDGLNDMTDKFAWDNLNGKSTDMPVDYPFLNGNPGFGFFGMGFTGLMTNNTTDYQNNFDLSKPNLIMGGAAGIATTPAEAGDPTTNDQKYSFQFGVDVSQTTPSFIIQSKLLGSSFFDGTSDLGTQSQGIYFGTGDQDNYMKLVVHANNGNPGFQILIENGGVVTYSDIFPVNNILSASAIDVFFDINPANGAVQCKYQTNSAESPVLIGPAFTMTGNMLTALQNNNAIAVGLIASAGNKTEFTASWDYVKVTSSVPQTLTEVVRINAGGANLQFGSELWKADQYFSGGSTFSSTIAISNTTNDALYQSERKGNMTYNIPVPQSGRYTVDLHFAEIYFSTSGSRVFNVNVENGEFALQNIDLYKDYGGKGAASVIKASNVQVSDGFITIALTSVVNNSKISGIAVFLQSGATTENRPPVVSKPADVSLTSGQSWSYQVIASDPDPGDVLTYSATGLPASLSINASTGLISGSISASVGTYTVNLTVKDQQNLSASTSFVIAVASSGDLTEVIRINAGGANLQFGSELWKADQYFSGGGTFSSTIPISNTTNDALYQSERKGNMTYNIPVPQSGQYTVDLHFAEIYFSTSGSRIFNVSVESGQFALQNIDLYKDYGGKGSASVVKASNVQVSDGFLTITLTSVVNNAKISGIAVFLQSGTTTNQAPVANAGPDQTITLPIASVVLSGSGSDPEDGTNVTYSWGQVSGPSTAAFSSTSQASPTVSNLIAGTYVFGLTVQDSKLLSSPSDQVSVTVNPATIGNQEVVSFTLINASNEQEIQTLSSNTTLNLATLPSQSLNIRANTSPATVGSVVFALSGTETHNHTDTGAPYALFGDVNGNYNTWTPAVGSYTLSGTPYSSAGGGGTAGTPLTINFTVVNQNPANQPPVITKPPNANVIQGQIFSYQVIAHDPEGTALSYSANNLPASLNINTSTGLISGTVSVSKGSYTVTLTVRDLAGLTASTNFVIKVSNPNKPLSMENPGNLSLLAGQNQPGETIAGQTAIMTAKPLPLYESITVENNISQFKTKVFPNPAHREFSITFGIKDRSEWKFTLYSTKGQMIQLRQRWLDKGIATVTFDLTSYNVVPGMYYLIMTSNLNERKNTKIIIN